MRRIGVGLVLRRHSWFLTEGRNGGDGRCPGSLSVVPLPKGARR